jgi:hypothetical protein
LSENQHSTPAIQAGVSAATPGITPFSTEESTPFKEFVTQVTAFLISED